MTQTLRRPAAFALTLAAFAWAFPAFAEMTLMSADMAEGQGLSTDQVLDGFGCTGGNMAPSLSWEGAPEGTKSFVITAYDPDAPTGSGWWHWSVFNIPADVTSLPEGTGTPDNPLPAGAIAARNDFSLNAFGGACPPEGGDAHRYIFTVYAMPQDALPLDETASGAMVGYFASGGSLARASLTAIFRR
jgi:Raf kinase inhibitor-like YbhB/YbcL family protein